MFLNFNALIVSLMTIVAVDAIAADRALATNGASWSTPISGTKYLSAGQPSADDGGHWQRETFGGPGGNGGPWRHLQPTAAQGGPR